MTLDSNNFDPNRGRAYNRYLDGPKESGIKKFKKDAKDIGWFLLGQFSHLAVTYVPPVILLYIFNVNGWLTGASLAGLAPVIVIYIFVAWWATAKWRQWGR